MILLTAEKIKKSYTEKPLRADWRQRQRKIHPAENHRWSDRAGRRCHN